VEWSHLPALSILLATLKMKSLLVRRFLRFFPRSNETDSRCHLACRTLSTAQALSSDFPRTQPLSLDVASAADLDTQVAAHALVISLVPYTHHAAVIKSAIKGRTNVVTTSYVSAEMRALDDAVKEAGITVLNEVGVDPGVDHLYAIKTINEVHEKGGKACTISDHIK
jgi:saccharopine dehydrogenase-like NADP-dependent oxidoreductase